MALDRECVLLFVLPLARRYVPATIASRCSGCCTPLALGDLISPRRRDHAIAWVCARCDADTTDLDHVLSWLELAVQRSRTPSLTREEADVLLAALDAQCVPASRRGERRAWHPAASATAQFALPAAAHAHGLLRDAREHGFSARLPAGYLHALLEVCAPAAPRAD